MEIPQTILQEAYKAVAERRGIALSQLKLAEISEEELYSAIAYTKSIPEIDLSDLMDEDLKRSAAICRELEFDALKEYRFIPLDTSYGMLLAVSTCPWDPNTMEVAPDYFPSVTYCRFMLATEQNFMAIANRVKSLCAGDVRTTGPAASKSIPAQKLAAPSESRVITYVPKVTTPGGSTMNAATVPTAKPTTAIKTPNVGNVQAVPAPSGVTGAILEGLDANDVASLMSQMIDQANRILQAKRKGDRS